MTIAPEGKWVVGGAFAIAVVAFLFWGLSSWPLWAVLVFAAQFFREPRRDIRAAADEIVSPADGRVVFVGRAKSPADGAEMVKISVFMNIFNVHSNRSPAAGEVCESRRFAGAFFNAALDKSSDKNERHMIVIDNAHGKIVCVQIAGFLARRVLCHSAVGDVLQVGERYGFIRFGSRADLYLPPHLRPIVALGDSVVGGITRMAVVR